MKYTSAVIRHYQTQFDDRTRQLANFYQAAWQKVAFAVGSRGLIHKTQAVIDNYRAAMTAAEKLDELLPLRVAVCAEKKKAHSRLKNEMNIASIELESRLEAIKRLCGECYDD